MGEEAWFCLLIGQLVPEMQMRLLLLGGNWLKERWRRGWAPGHFTEREKEGEGMSQLGPGLRE